MVCVLTMHFHLIILEMIGIFWYFLLFATPSFCAEEYDFLAQIRFKDNGSLHCGGSVVNEEYILTSCYCVGFFDSQGEFQAYDQYVFIVSAKVGQVIAQESTVGDMFPFHQCRQIQDEVYINDLGAYKLAKPFVIKTRGGIMKPPSSQFNDHEVVFFNLRNQGAACTIFSSDGKDVWPVTTKLALDYACGKGVCQSDENDELCRYMMEPTKNQLRCSTTVHDCIAFPGSPLIHNGTVWGVSSFCTGPYHFFAPLDICYSFYMDLVNINSVSLKTPQSLLILYSFTLFTHLQINMSQMYS